MLRRKNFVNSIRSRLIRNAYVIVIDQGTIFLRTREGLFTENSQQDSCTASNVWPILIFVSTQRKFIKRFDESTTHLTSNTYPEPTHIREVGSVCEVGTVCKVAKKMKFERGEHRNLLSRCASFSVMNGVSRLFGIFGGRVLIKTCPIESRTRKSDASRC